MVDLEQPGRPGHAAPDRRERVGARPRPPDQGPGHARARRRTRRFPSLGDALERGPPGADPVAAADPGPEQARHGDRPDGQEPRPAHEEPRRDRRRSSASTTSSTTSRSRSTGTTRSATTCAPASWPTAARAYALQAGRQRSATRNFYKPGTESASADTVERRARRPSPSRDRTGQRAGHRARCSRACSAPTRRRSRRASARTRCSGCARGRTSPSRALTARASRCSTTCSGVSAVRGRGGGAALAASPVLVGAVTVLVTIVAVFLSYNANSGLPFVPTYDLKANLPNAAQLVEGFEVRIGGARVGVISDIDAEAARRTAPSYAQVTMKLDKQIEPLPADSTLLVRPRSAVGLKYIELTPGGSGGPDLEAGSTIPVRQARTPRRARRVLRHVRRQGAGRLAQLARRLRRRARRPRPGPEHGDRGVRAARRRTPSRCCATCRTRRRSSRRFFRSLADTATEVAPVAEQQASLFVQPRHVVHGARRRSPARSSRRRSARARRPRRSRSATSRRSARSCATTRRSSRSSVPAWRRCRTRRRSWPTPSRPAPSVLPKTIPANEDLGGRVQHARRLLRGPGRAQRASTSSRGWRPRCEPTLNFLTPAQTTCNYATLWFRNAASLLSDGDSHRHLAALPVVSARPTRASCARRPAVYGPNNEGGPSSAPAERPARATTCTSTPTRTRPRPARPRSARPATSTTRDGRKTTIGNPPGNQGTKTGPGR